MSNIKNKLRLPL